MRLLSLVLLVVGTFASGSIQGTCAAGWNTGASSCYLLNDTAVSWETAWEFCLFVDPTSSLVVIESELENELLGAFSCPVANQPCLLDNFWTAGTRNGWRTNETDSNGAYVHIDYTFENWYQGTRENAGWTSTNKDNLKVINTRYGKEWQMDFPSTAIGFICEIPLSSCYTDLATDRTVWSRTYVGNVANQSCPTGYVGLQYRECTATATFLTPTTTNCSAVIDENGWVDDTFADGFAWVDSNLIVSGAHGPFTPDSYNTKSFYIGDVDNSTYPYLHISFLAEPVGGFDGEICIEISGVDAGCSAVSGTSNTTWSQTLGREQFDAMEYFDFTIKAEMSNAGVNSTAEVYIYDLYLTPFTRQEMSEDCYRLHSFNESIANPIFEEASSGFLSTNDDLTFQFSIPRELYDIEIAFVGQEEAQVGYTEEIRDYSLWESTRETTNYAKCGRETWTAAIPWTSLGGVFTSVENFNNGTHTVGNNNQDYYVFTAVLNITATEKLVAYSSLTQRTWTLTRSATWRYPFALKWQRNVHVDADLNVFVCATGSTICTVRHVTAIISFIQTEVNPIAGLQTNANYGTVVVGILTKVAYPYMFVSGRALDDPPKDQITNSSIGANYTQDSLYASWQEPIVEASPDIVDSVQQTVTASMQFQWEDESSCTHLEGAVEFSTQQECEQTWALTITPTEGSCYVNGEYLIKFSARCMYGKAVCVFLQENGKYQNGVDTTLSIKSTQMCPDLVENVDLRGYLCSTGRSQDQLGYGDDCDSDPTYIQGEETHFKTEITSDLAAINKTEIIQIWATQDFSLWNTADAAAQGLLPRFDTTYDAKVLLWQEGDSLPAENDFDDGGAAVASSLLQTIVEVKNSDSDQGFAANKAGFKVNLNPYIFPSPHDRSTDIVFTVVLRATYQGFNEFDRSTGILSDDSTFGGSEDHSWCAGILANDFGGDVSLFCAEYDDAATYCTSTCGSGRRNLRRVLQQDVINGGDDFMQLEARVSLQPQKAEINGHVDPDSQRVRFVLQIQVGDEHIDEFNHNRPLYYSKLQYKLGHLAAALEGQVQILSVTRLARGDKQALQVTIDIVRPDFNDGVLPQSLTPFAVAGKLEMVIQTGKVYQDDWFQHTEFYSMQYEAIDDTPDRVHFGDLSPLDDTVVTDSSVGAFSILLSFILTVFLLY